MRRGDCRVVCRLYGLLYCGTSCEILKGKKKRGIRKVNCRGGEKEDISLEVKGRFEGKY